MIDEGYVKYQCRWINQLSVSDAEIEELNRWRAKLYSIGAIGQYDNGIGFGNISVRIGRSLEFIISGTQTGGLPHLTSDHYTKVTEFDWETNTVVCVGSIKASSETLTHAAIYSADSEVNAVIHVHYPQLWQKLLDRVPTTNPNCAYGTPDMAREIISLSQQPAVKAQKIVIMSGHRDGILTFGKDLDEAGGVFLKFLKYV